MNINFAIRLTDLRREKNISQKEASSCLGISQALLSHYEKGIRECGLDFLKKACDYYDVTADYLLGLTENRHGLNDIYSKDELPTDDELKVKTMFRAMVSLSEKLGSSGEITANKLNSGMLLSIYRFILLGAANGNINKELFNIDISKADSLVSSLLDEDFELNNTDDKNSSLFYEDTPEFILTVIRESEKEIKKRYMKYFNENKEDA